MEPLSDSAFSRWATLLESRVGVRVTPAWEGHVRRTLNAHLQYLKFHSKHPSLLPAAGMAGWWRGLLDQLLIRETAFFRHRPSFDYLNSYLSDKALCPTKDVLRLWSAGCATGEEAYSLAITAQQALPNTRFDILATDISEAALSHARTATYKAARLSGLKPSERGCFAPLSDGRMQVTAALRSHVHFTHHNLVDRHWPVETQEMDIIFCQHLLVYFGPERRDAVVARLADCLKPGGCLVLGPGEYLSRPIHGMQRDKRSDVLAFVRSTDSRLEC